MYDRTTAVSYKGHTSRAERAIFNDEKQQGVTFKYNRAYVHILHVCGV